VNAPLIDLFKEFVIVAIVEVDSNEHRSDVSKTLDVMADYVANNFAVAPLSRTTRGCTHLNLTWIIFTAGHRAGTPAPNVSAPRHQKQGVVTSSEGDSFHKPSPARSALAYGPDAVVREVYESP
jgi:hypothetical protein